MVLFINSFTYSRVHGRRVGTMKRLLPKTLGVMFNSEPKIKTPDFSLRVRVQHNFTGPRPPLEMTVVAYAGSTQQSIRFSRNRLERSYSGLGIYAKTVISSGGPRSCENILDSHPEREILCFDFSGSELNRFPAF